ncbi:hypothetical protein [Actinopolyspora mortivallis]|uniref:Uncharacterized protein n=1 Tax=Actinopolyspora mortivallis TaxID=33906 RepID=A0A2T0GTE1_ACTMO|nr:hypothetical protein [Actinopolyspora mortivallis]PRW62303.1 hypothetical protein CEP50_16235 [Actinopolyspora mortivallis]
MTVPASAPAYDVDTVKRHLITPQNLAELGITEESVRDILKRDELKHNGQSPTGLSVNETTFGEFSGPTAADRGWMAYMNIGAPLVEERSDITQPPPDVLSTRAYVNRAEGVARHFEDTVEFSISNTISWSVEGTAQLTFGARTSAELETQIQKSLQNSVQSTTSHNNINHQHPENQGSETQDRTEKSTTNTTTDTAIGAARGTSELFAQLMLGITASVSGSLTTSWSSRSTISGDIPGGQRVETLATQRRQVKQYTYELPVTFAGYVALHYPDRAPVRELTLQDFEPEGAEVVARDIRLLGLVEHGEQYRPKGIAETVSALDVEHTAFAPERIAPAAEQLNEKRPHNLGRA